MIIKKKTVNNGMLLNYTRYLSVLRIILIFDRLF